MQPANARLAVLTLSLTLTLTKAATAHRVTDLLEHQWTSLSEPAVLPLTTEPMPEPLLRTTARWKGAMASGLGHTPHSSEGQGTGDRGLQGTGDRPSGLGSRASATPRSYACGYSPRHLRLQPPPPTVAGKHHAKDEIAMWTVAVPKQRELSGLTPYDKAMSVQVEARTGLQHTHSRGRSLRAAWDSGLWHTQGSSLSHA